MSDFPVEMSRFIRERAAERCEYCLMHQSLQGATFHIEHITPESLGGTNSLENLALACPGCNLHKSNRVKAVDPESGTLISLFNPRRDKWSDHFTWSGFEVRALTPLGRAMVAALDLNHERRIKIRTAEEKFELFPPIASYGDTHA